MSELTRFGVSIEKELLEDFDNKLKLQSYETRSKAISDLVKEYVSQDVINGNGIVAGAVSFLYDHHNKEMVSKLLEIQHNDHDIILSMQHIHLDHHNCLEILAIRGKAEIVRNLYYKIKGLKGVKLTSINVIPISYF